MKKRPQITLVPPPGTETATPAASPPAPPAYGLRPEIKEWVDTVLVEFELEEHHKRLLDLAAMQLSRAAVARETLDREGLVYYDRFRQPKERPEVAIERNAANQARLLLRELGLDLPQPDPNRPPRIGG